jgi:hypothetical protein
MKYLTQKSTIERSNHHLFKNIRCPALTSLQTSHTNDFAIFWWVIFLCTKYRSRTAALEVIFNLFVAQE